MMESHCLETDLNLPRALTGSLERMLKMRSGGRVVSAVSPPVSTKNEKDFRDDEEEAIPSVVEF